MPTTSPYLSFLYQALASRFGGALSVSDVQQAKAALYKARAESADPDLARISIHQSPYSPEDELLLVKRPAKPASAPASTPEEEEEDAQAGK